jgi:hypothetical protein
MLARGCVVNGANVIIIDVNELALEEAKVELEHLASASLSSSPAQVTRSVRLLSGQMSSLTTAIAYAVISQARRESRRWWRGSKRILLHSMHWFIVREYVT